MKKRLRLVLALVLAVAICAALAVVLIPIVSNAGVPTVVYAYNQYVQPHTSVRKVTFADTHGFWAYHADSTTSRITVQDSSGIETGRMGTGEWLAVKIQVPAAGKYTMLQQYGMHSENGGTADVYILPGNTANAEIGAALTEYTCVGSLDFHGADAVAEAKFGKVSFPAEGEYLIVYQATGADDSYFYIGDVTLQGGKQQAIMDLAVSVPRNTLKVNETLQIEHTAYFSNGESAEVEYQYTSGNENASVSADGVITALANGKLDIQVTATVPGFSKTASLDLTASPWNLNGKAYLYDIVSNFSAGHPLESITYQNTGNTWECYQIKGSSNSVKMQFYGIQDLNASFEHYIALKINVPTAGDYMFTQTYIKYKTGCKAGVYILPVDTPKENIRDAFATASTLKTIDFYEDTSDVNNTTEDLGMVSFPTAGEYLVVYDPNSNFGSANMFLGNIYLDGVNGLKSVVLDKTDITLDYKQTHQSKITLYNSDDSIKDIADCVITYRSQDPQIAKIDEDGVISAVGCGTTNIDITASNGEKTVKATCKVTVQDNSGIQSVRVGVAEKLYVRQSVQAPLIVTMNSGNQITLPEKKVTISLSAGAPLSVEEGIITANQEGSATITVSGNLFGQQVSAQQKVSIVQHPGKNEPTYYTNEMRRIAKENIAKYPWAQALRDNAVKNAEYYMDRIETYYDLIMREGIPRSRQYGYTGDAHYGYCRYCGVNVMGIYGNSGTGGYNFDPINHPWKIQCMDCKRWFPSNDFESFYKLGLDQGGKFDYDKAWAENDKLIASGHPGYLVNELYPEMGKYWGVDDGFGAREYKDGSEYHKYIPNDPNLDKPKSAVYIAMWAHDMWYEVWRAVNALSTAYVYTGDIQYGRAGAILLDRIADVTPEYNFRNYSRYDYLVTCGGTGYGTYVGRINDCLLSTDFAKAADAFFPMLDDPELIANLSAKADTFGLANDKSSGEKIWQNWRNNLLMPALRMAEEGQIKGNYGMAQKAVAMNALVLAEEPESSKMMEWIYQADTSTDNLTATGGNFSAQIIDVVDRDGFGNEASPAYNVVWLNNLYEMADAMAMFQSNKSFNPYENPKFVQMFLNWNALVQSDYYTVQIGDSGDIASGNFSYHTTTQAIIDLQIAGWKHLKDTPLAKKIAEYIYVLSYGNLNGLNYGIFTENPESLKDDILALVEEGWQKTSEMLPGYGYATLKDGYTKNRNSLRSIWVYHGRNQGHGHQDTLNIAIDAFGLNLTPDLGYPANTINDPSNFGFTRPTISHNTVVVDGANQIAHDTAEDPYIFDDSGLVKVMGVEAKDAYTQTDSYNRTLVMVKVDDTNSYYVDFFRILGGSQHTYSFHAQSHSATPVSGLNLVKQVDANGNYVGTYAGANIAKAAEGGFPIGYNYFTKVRKDTALASNAFSVDFEITDYRKALGNNGTGIHLKMTQINNFTPDEVAIVGGHVNVKAANKVILNVTDTLEYVLTQRKAKNGEKLDSLFSTVFEPYRNESYLAAIEEVPVTVISGTPGATDLAKALLITHKDGRKDYVFYATNNTVTYRVNDLFAVNGYVGVYSLNSDGKEAYRYVTGGDMIVDELKKTAVYTGKVLNYSTGLTLDENFIDVNLDASVADELAGKFIYIQNDGQQNAVYKIEKATAIDGGVRLDIGSVSLVRSMQNKLNEAAGYIYNIEKSQAFQIPMSYLVTP